MRSCTEATQAVDRLEGGIAERFGLESVMGSGDLPKIVADVSHNVYTDVVVRKAGLVDIFGGVVKVVLNDLSSPF